MPGRKCGRVSGRNSFQEVGIFSADAELEPKSASEKKMPGRKCGRVSGRNSFQEVGIFSADAELE